MKLSQLAPHIIQKFYNTLLTSGCKKPKRDKDGRSSRRTDSPSVNRPHVCKDVRNIHGTLTKALSTADDIGYLRFNPADRVTLPRIEKKELSPLTDAQVKDFLRESSNDELEIILKVILFTGLRESEALGLTWDNIDFQAGTIKVCKQLQKRRQVDGGATLAPTKNGRSRTLKPAPFVMELLDRQYRAQAAQRLKMGDLWQAGRPRRNARRPGVHHARGEEHFPDLPPLSLQESRGGDRRSILPGARSPAHVRRPVPAKWG